MANGYGVAVQAADRAGVLRPAYEDNDNVTQGRVTFGRGHKPGIVRRSKLENIIGSLKVLVVV